MSISQALARFVVATDGTKLGEREVSGATEAISDCIGCAVAGSFRPSATSTTTTPTPGTSPTRRCASAGASPSRWMRWIAPAVVY